MGNDGGNIFILLHFSLILIFFLIFELFF